MHAKTIQTRVLLSKADGGTADVPAGQFEALVAVFDNQDSYGDVIRKGAFARTLDAWAASGMPIPIYYSHRLDDPDMNIGHVVSAQETDRGLQVVGQLDMETPKAVQVHRLWTGKRLNQFSFSYAVPPGGGQLKSDDGDGGGDYYELTDLDLFEVGPTPVGANQETELLAVKDARFVAQHMLARVERERAQAAQVPQGKQGKVLSDANLATLQSAYDAIGKVIKAAQGGDDSSSDSGKANNGTGSGKAEDRVSGKAEDPGRRALSAIGVGDPPLTPSDALTALALVDIRSISHDSNHQRTA